MKIQYYEYVGNDSEYFINGHVYEMNYWANGNGFFLDEQDLASGEKQGLHEAYGMWLYENFKEVIS